MDNAREECLGKLMVSAADTKVAQIVSIRERRT